MAELTNSQALAIARQAIVGKASPDPGAPVEIDRVQGTITVTFVHETPQNMLGADYDARVVIDAVSGEVLQLLVGS